MQSSFKVRMKLDFCFFISFKGVKSEFVFGLKVLRFSQHLNRQKLFQNFKVIEQGKNDTYQEIDINKTADKTDDDVNNRNLCENTDDESDNYCGNELKNDRNDERGDILLLIESIGPKFFKKSHNNPPKINSTAILVYVLKIFKCFLQKKVKINRSVRNPAQRPIS